jgi:flavin-dependent dehydrogenase
MALAPTTAEHFDLAVIGAGPGGGACALTAARAGLSVGLFEPQLGPIDKPCGEGCLASGVRVLRELGFQDVLEDAQVLRRVTYALSSGQRLDVPFPQAGCALERPKLATRFDRALLAEADVVRVTSTAQVERHGEGFLIRAGEREFLARTLAVADGARGRSAEWLRGERWLENSRFGLRARFEAREALDGVLILMSDQRVQTYITPLPGGRLNVALLMDRAPQAGGSRACLQAMLAQPELARLVGEERSEPQMRSLARRVPLSSARDRVFLVGDAAGGVDPIVGCGVSVALTTGVAAARGALALLEGAPPRRIEREYARIVRRETRSRARLARALLSLARHPQRALWVMRVLDRAPRAVALLARVAEG